MSVGESKETNGQSDVDETTPVAVKAGGKKRMKADANGAAKKAKNKDKADGFEFVGRVEGISAGDEFVITLRNKKGDDARYRLDSSNAGRFSAMAAAVSAAFGSGAKVHVKSAPSAGLVKVAGEIEIRTKK